MGDGGWRLGERMQEKESEEAPVVVFSGGVVLQLVVRPAKLLFFRSLMR